MDVELENLQFLGLFGILQETIKLIYQWRKIFTHIALAFILPISLSNFANIEISSFFLQKIKPPNIISSQIIIYYLTISIISLIFSIIFSLLATAAITYTVACIYTAHDVSFKHAISIVAKVWKRLLVTFLSVFVALFAFYFVAILVILLIRWMVVAINGPINGFGFDNYSLTILFIFMIFIFVGTWYLTIIWQLSGVVSVLEESCGFKAMAKSKALVKGKMRMVTMLMMMLNLPLGAIQLVLYHLSFQSTLAEVGNSAIAWVLYFSLFFLIKLVAETVMYFVCKSYHQECVDKSALSDHLQGCLQVDYVLLKVEDE